MHRPVRSLFTTAVVAAGVALLMLPVLPARSAGPDGAEVRASARTLDLGAIAWQPRGEHFGAVAPLALDADGEPAVMLRRFERGTVVPPHGGPAERAVVLTVLRGTLSYGEGTRVDPAAERRVGAGGVLVVPAGRIHWVAARESEVIVQLVMTRLDRLTPAAALSP